MKLVVMKAHAFIPGMGLFFWLNIGISKAPRRLNMKRSYEMIKTVAAGGLVLALAMGLASCSGGGGGSAPLAGGSTPTGTALVVAEKVSVVDAQQQQQKPQQQKGMAGLLGVLFAGMISSDLPAASDYVNDKVSV